MNKPNQNFKRKSVVGDKLMYVIEHMSELTNFEDEKKYLNKLEILDGNLTNIFQHKKNLVMRDMEMKENNLEKLSKDVEIANYKNSELRKKLTDLENQYQHLNFEFKKCSEMRQKYYNDIIKIRRDNTKEFDNKLNTVNKQDKNLKMLKKELFLLINLLKLRVVNLDTIEEDKFIKGYILDLEKNTIKYIEVNRSQEALSDCFTYWTSMKELLCDKKINQELEKENVGMDNLINIKK
jgi:hypothetical protein